MFCQKCGNELADGQNFCPRCGERAGNPAAMPPSGLGPGDGVDRSWGEAKVGAWAVLGLVVAALFVVYLYVGSGNDRAPEPAKPAPEPAYTEKDAMKELQWWAETVASYPEKADDADYATALKIAGQLWNIDGELKDITSKVPYSNAAWEAAAKIRQVLPAVQKSIFPKLRRAWVNGEAENMAQYRVRVRCANKSCDKVNYVGDRYYSDALALDDAEKTDSEYKKLRFKVVVHTTSRGGGITTKMAETSDETIF